MSNSTSALGGLIFATVVGALGVAAAGWFGLSYHYGELRHEVAQRVMSSADWSPQRVPRNDATADCSAANLRQEAERLLDDVDVFELSKIQRFRTAPKAQRARELGRTLRSMEPSFKAFLEAYGCKGLGRLPRSRRQQQLSGPLITDALGVALWLDPARVDDLRKALWIGRDIQSSSGIYEFIEGALVMEAAAAGLALRLPEGDLDPHLDTLIDELQEFVRHEESAYQHWRAGARVLIGDLLGPDWDANPPTPLQAKAILESMDDVLNSLDALPDLTDAPYAERHRALTAWTAEHDLGVWGPKFEGFGEAGIEADARTTHAQAQVRALLVGLALRAFYRSRGYCPRKLDDLQRYGLLDAVPADPIADAPFDYDPRACAVRSASTPTGLPAIVVRARPE